MISAVILLVSLPFGLLFHAKDQTNEKGIISGGGFETNEFWNGSCRIESDVAFEGRFILSAKSTSEYSNWFEIAPYAKVTVGFWYKNSTVSSKDKFWVANSKKAQVRSASLSATDGWTYAEIKFTASDSGGNYALAIKGEELLVDAVSIFYENVGEIVPNGSFEKGFLNWQSFGNGASLCSDERSDGLLSAKLSNGAKSGIYCDIDLDMNTEYTVNISYLGGGIGSGWGIAPIKGNNTDADILLTGKLTFESSNEWSVSSGNFNSGFNDKLRIIIYAPSIGFLCVDDVSITVSENANLIKNGGFEQELEYWSTTGAYVSVKEDIVNSGSKSLQLAKEQYESVYQHTEVKKNTDYVLNFKVWTGSGNEWSALRVYGCDETSLGGENLGQTNFNGDSGVWREFSLCVNSGEHKYLCVQLVTDTAEEKLTRIDDICLTEKPLTKTEETLIKNGGFEEGLENWYYENGTPRIINTNVHKGNNSLGLSLNKYSHVYQEIEAKPLTYYKLSFFCYGGVGDYSSLTVQSGDDYNNSLAHISLYKPAGEWHFITQTFKTDEKGNFRIKITTDTDNSSLLLDDFSLLELENGDVLVNGDFEYGLNGWNYDEGYVTLDDDKYSGDSALCISDGYYKKIYQPFFVEKNKKYEIVFYYKGKISSAAPQWCIATECDFNSPVLKAYGIFESKEDYTKKSAVFESGENTLFYLIFQSIPDCDYMIDGITVKESLKTAQKDIVMGEEAKFEEMAKGTFYSNSFYVTSPQNNLFTNGEFEGENGIANKLLENGATLEYDTQLVYEGEKSIEFKAMGGEKIASAGISLEKNQTYHVSFFTKYPKYDSYNHGEITYGIADAVTGDFIYVDDSGVYSKKYQILPVAADDKWHLQGFTFNTNDRTDFYFVIRGKNATAYFDNIAIFKEKNAIQYVAPLEKIGDIDVSDNSPEKLGAKEECNLVYNFDFSKNESGWDDTRSTIYGDSLKIVDTRHSSQGNAMHYKSSRKNPLSIYYIKWIDVKPDTEYTFSARFSVIEKGGGYFGLISGNRSDIYEVTENMVYPTEILTVKFNESNYEENHNWKDVGISFNSGDRNRVGFVVLDKGGEAYIDDIRLFETKNGEYLAKAEDTSPNVLASVTGGISVADGKITGVSHKWDIASLLKSFESSRYLRIYDENGTEITDYTRKVKSGMEIRLMNGPVFKDSAVVYLKGDTNLDGYVNLLDLVRLKKEMAQNIFRWQYDINSDGILNAKDLTNFKRLLIE